MGYAPLWILYRVEGDDLKTWEEVVIKDWNAPVSAGALSHFEDEMQEILNTIGRPEQAHIVKIINWKRMEE